MRVRLLTALCFGGQRTEAGTEIDLSDHEAREAIHRGAVERVTPAPVAPAPMTTESVPAIVAGKKRKREG